MTNLTNLTTFPSRPENEVPRDNLVIQIASTFNANCQKQVVIGESLTGKTNLLAQFARHYPDRCISYFITDDPWTQRPYNFIYAMCYQLCELLEEPLPPITIDLNGLKSQFTALTTKLNMKAKSSKITFFYVIDGLEWESQGNEEDKIVNNLPRIFPIGPYLLYSCQESKLDSLPRHIKADRSYKPLAFSQSETQTYLSFVGFSMEEAKEIHQRHKGNPGSLKAVYDAKKGDSQFSLESALQEYDRVIEQQINSYLSRKPDFVSDTLNYLSVCPTGLSTSILAGLLNIDKERLIAALKDSGASIITIHNNNERIDFSNEVARRICSKLANQERASWFVELLNFVEQNHSDEEFLLTTLYIEAKDYKGLQKQLTSLSIVTTVENPLNGVSGVLQRLRSASQMAVEEQDYEGLLKWSLGISVVKSYIEHTINHDEIEALIAIGESQEALRRAYSLPDSTNRIRFMARIYSTMKAKNERVSKEALEELEVFINSLNVSQLDREIVEKLAIDIFPLLPDVSLALLDTVKIDEDKNGVIELFSKAISEQFKEAASESETDSSEKQSTKFVYSRIFSEWLEDKPLSELEKEMTHLKTTKAKEQLARQWCKQNSGSPDLAKGIFLWLETVKSDYDFVITLKSLQQISSLLRDVPVQIRVDLIRDLNVPRITVLDSPKQEWIRFNLNLAEGLAEIDAQESLNKVSHLYEQVLEESLDLDIETFCLARILSTITRIFPDQKTMRDMVERKFNTTFYSLLKDSAEQFDSLHETLGAFVEIDLACALVMTSELNISQRREWAKAHIFRVALLRKGNENISKPLEDILENLEKGRRPSVVINILNELRMRGNSIAEENLNILDTFVTNFEDPSDRAIALAMLAELMPSNGNEIAKRAVESWRQEADLKVNLSLGFQLVEILAKVDLDFATEIYQEVKELFSRPGMPLAVGSLGDDFVSNVELAIRAVAGLPNNLIAENVEIIQGWISRLPAKRVQGDLYAKLASSLYRADANKLANEIVRTNILAIIGKLTSSVDRRDLIHFSLPIIYKYDQAEADTLSNALLVTQRDTAWFSVVLWTFANCFLGDLVGINPSHLKVSFDRPQLMEAITVAKKLQQDLVIYSAVEAIAHVIQQSDFSRRINPTQSLELLDELEKLIEDKLPDLKNIQHEGYLILADSEIHRVRSILFNQKRARHLSKSDIGKKWQNLCDRASQISNVADRVFVMSLVARNMSDYHEKDKSRIVEILENAHQQIGSIPTLIDRLERLDTLADTWHKIGEKTKAQFAIEQGIVLLNQFQGTSRDERLKAIVQTAYAIGDADLASEVVSQLDKPNLPDGMLSTPQRTLQMEALRKQPIKVNEIINVTNLVHEREYILGLSANHLLEDLVTGRGKTDHPRTLGMWLRRSHDLHPVVIRDISSWVVENWVRGGPKKHISIFQEIIGLVVQMAESTAVQRLAIPQTIENSFAGLSSKYVVFRPGETEKAQTWLRHWLTTNAKKYLKICDPYFGVEELEYLSCVPESCLVFVVTTTKGGEMAQNNSEIIKRHWQKISTRAMPFTRFTVVSTKSEHLFHDRVIISEGCGLDIGPSLNGLGKSQQKISMLSIEEASELEHKYLKDMLDSTVWLMEQGENPSVFSVGELPSW